MRLPVLVAFALMAAAVESGAAGMGGSPRTSTTEAFSRPPGDDAAGQRLRYQVDEGTWLSLDVSPDSAFVWFDLLGDIYRAPIDGGKTERVRAGDSWDTAPQLSPSGDRVAFVSDGGEGMRELWIMDTDGGNATQVTDTERDIAKFVWNDDGRSLNIVRSPAKRLADNEVVELELDTGSLISYGPGTNRSFNATRRDRQGWFYVDHLCDDEVPGFVHAICISRYDPATGLKVEVIRNGFAPELAPDGQTIAFVRQIDGVSTLWLKTIGCGTERQLSPQMTKGIVTGDLETIATQGIVPKYDFAPSGEHVVFTRGGKLWRVEIATNQQTLIPFLADIDVRIAPRFVPKLRVADDFVVRQLLWLDVAPDLRTLVFAAAGRIWISLDAGKSAKRLTSADAPEYAPVLSPDGSAVAYVTTSDCDGSQLLVKHIGADRISAVYESTGTVVHPAWSPDGESLVFSEVVATSCGDARDEAAGPDIQCAGAPDDRAVDLVSLSRIAVSGGDVEVLSRYWATSRFYVSLNSATTFSDDGARLFFSRFATDSKGNEVAEIAVLGNDDGPEQSHVVNRGDSDAEAMVVSPDGRLVAVAAADGVWIERAGKDDSAPLVLERPLGQSSALRIGPAATHLTWVDASTLVWAYGNRLFRWKAGQSRATEFGRIELRVPRAMSAGELVLRNARIITMNGNEVIERGRIAIRGGRVVALSAADEGPDPSGAVVVDLQGKTVVPGYVDTHVHPHAVPSRKWEYYYDINLNYLSLLSWGITTAFDPQTSARTDAFAQAEMVAAGTLTGPRIYSTGGALAGSTAGGNWAHRTGELTAPDMERLRKVVRNRGDNGAVFLKSYSVDRRDWRQALVSLTGEAAIGITTEGAGRQMRQLTHVVDGHTAIEHNLPVAPLYTDVVELLARSGVFYTPTLPVSYGGVPADRLFFARGDMARSERTRRFWREPGWGAVEYDVFTADSEHHVYDVARSARSIVAAGGRVTVGGHGRPHGLSAHWDMWLLQMGGMTPTDVLRSATVVGAEKLGLEKELGSLEVGKLADLVVLNCNPLENIRCTAEIEYTVKSGFVYHAESMTQLYPEYESIAKPCWHSDGVWEELKPGRPEPLSVTAPGASTGTARVGISDIAR